MDAKITGKFIADARKRKKMTQAELGDSLHVTDKAVSKWECGKCLPDSSLLEEISKVLEVSIYELLKGEYIEQEAAEAENTKIVSTLFQEVQKLKKNTTLAGALCAILISFITAIYSLLWPSGERAYEQFFAGFVKGVSAASLIVGIFLIFYAWVKFAERNTD